MSRGRVCKKSSVVRRKNFLVPLNARNKNRCHDNTPMDCSRRPKSWKKIAGFVSTACFEKINATSLPAFMLFRFFRIHSLVLRFRRLRTVLFLETLPDTTNAKRLRDTLFFLYITVPYFQKARPDDFWRIRRKSSLAYSRYFLARTIAINNDLHDNARPSFFSSPAKRSSPSRTRHPF